MVWALQAWYGRIDEKHHHIAFRQNIRLLWGNKDPCLVLMTTEMPTNC
jgi:hypothetical protein